MTDQSLKEKIPLFGKKSRMNDESYFFLFPLLTSCNYTNGSSFNLNKDLLILRLDFKPTSGNEIEAKLET